MFIFQFMTHESKTDPDARLFRKSNGSQSRLCYLGHVLTENKHGLVVQAYQTRTSGTAERDTAMVMLDRQRPFDPYQANRRITLAGDKLYDAWDFVMELKAKKITTYIAMRDRNANP